LDREIDVTVGSAPAFGAPARLIALLHDENNCWRPAGIWSTHRSASNNRGLPCCALAKETSRLRADLGTSGATLRGVGATGGLQKENTER